jgi:hypothetical protein
VVDRFHYCCAKTFAKLDSGGRFRIDFARLFPAAASATQIENVREIAEYCFEMSAATI